MIASSLTTERERKVFSDLLDQWRKNHLPDAPREQLEAIEEAMYRYRPGLAAGERRSWR